MAKQSVKVIKKNRVNLTGTVRLGHVGGGVKPTATAQPSADERPAHTVPQQARIIESNNEYAIIEVTCSCGAVSHIQCNYAEMTKQ